MHRTNDQGLRSAMDGRVISCGISNPAISVPVCLSGLVTTTSHLGLGPACTAPNLHVILVLWITLMSSGISFVSPRARWTTASSLKPVPMRVRVSPGFPAVHRLGCTALTLGAGSFTTGGSRLSAGLRVCRSSPIARKIVSDEKPDAKPSATDPSLPIYVRHVPSLSLV